MGANVANEKPVRSVAIISTRAPSLVGFRGPLIAELVAGGVHVYALASDYNEQTRQQVIALGAEPIDFSLSRTGMNPLRDALDCYKLSVLLRRLQPQVSLGYYIKPVIFGTLAASIARVPHRVAMIEGLGFIFTDCGEPLSLRRKVMRSAVSWLYKQALKKAHRVIFLNPDDLAEFVHSGLVDSGKATILGGIGVDLDEWRMCPPHVSPITFLLVARLLREKGILQYAEAARLVKKQYPAVRFVLLGDLDTNPGSLQQSEVRAWVDEGLLEWPGHVPVQPWLEKTSVYVLPSYREGVPRSTQEALAMGRPVITTDVPGCRETVVEGSNGYLVPPRDAKALAEAMLRFIRQPELIVMMGRESRKLAEERFDVVKINKKILKEMSCGL